MSNFTELKLFLEEKVYQYNQRSFIESDPIQVPHRFTRKEDIEIAAFLTASIAWGKRSMIIKSAEQLINSMPGGPYEFIMEFTNTDLQRFNNYVYRTFNYVDLSYFLQALQYIYKTQGGLESIVTDGYRSGGVFTALVKLREVFFEWKEPGRTSKHLANVRKGASAKRMNMFLRWMVRQDKTGVDFGIWKNIAMSELFIPLDVHSGNTARSLGLLSRKQNDWKAVEELSTQLRKFDPADPVRYDFALFGIGAFENF